MSDRPPRAAVDRQLNRLDWESRRLTARIDRLEKGGGGGSGHDWQTQDLFAWGARQKKFRQSGSISVRRTLPSPSAARGARRSRDRNPRLGDYLYSGSFGRLTPARRDAGVQRNRILFSLLLLSLAFYVIHYLVSG